MANLTAEFVGSTYNDGKLTVSYEPRYYDSVVILTTKDEGGDPDNMAQISISMPQAKALASTLNTAIAMYESTMMETKG